MKRSEWQRAYDPDPVRLEARVRHTLANLDATPAARPRALRTALIAALEYAKGRIHTWTNTPSKAL